MVQQRQRPRRQALTLLEIIVAMAILAGALAVLGEVVRLAARSATETRTLTRAQLLASSKLAELTAGVTPLEAVQNVAFPSAPEWVYSIAVAATGEPGLVAVQITVAGNVDASGQPVEYSLLRWMADPSLATAESSPESEQDGVSTKQPY